MTHDVNMITRSITCLESNNPDCHEKLHQRLPVERLSRPLGINVERPEIKKKCLQKHMNCLLICQHMVGDYEHAKIPSIVGNFNGNAAARKLVKLYPVY